MCDACDHPDAPHVCGRCETARYCSADCQAYAWLVLGHRDDCGGMSLAGHAYLDTTVELEGFARFSRFVRVRIPEIDRIWLQKRNRSELYKLLWRIVRDRTVVHYVSFTAMKRFHQERVTQELRDDPAQHPDDSTLKQLWRLVSGAERIWWMNATESDVESLLRGEDLPAVPPGGVTVPIYRPPRAAITFPRPVVHHGEFDPRRAVFHPGPLRPTPPPPRAVLVLPDVPRAVPAEPAQGGEEDVMDAELVDDPAFAAFCQRTQLNQSQPARASLDAFRSNAFLALHPSLVRDMMNAHPTWTLAGLRGAWVRAHADKIQEVFNDPFAAADAAAQVWLVYTPEERQAWLLS
jgi:hypothetical protein